VRRRGGDGAGLTEDCERTSLMAGRRRLKVRRLQPGEAAIYISGTGSHVLKISVSTFGRNLLFERSDFVPILVFCFKRLNAEPPKPYTYSQHGTQSIRLVRSGGTNKYRQIIGRRCPFPENQMVGFHLLPRTPPRQSALVQMQAGPCCGCPPYAHPSCVTHGTWPTRSHK